MPIRPPLRVVRSSEPRPSRTRRNQWLVDLAASLPLSILAAAAGWVVLF